jgi:alpha-D-xyloside xylohydrolase
MTGGELLSQTTVSTSKGEGEQQLETSSASRIEKTKAGIIVPVGDHFLKVQVCMDRIIQVAFSTNREFFSRNSLAVKSRSPSKSTGTLKIDGDVATIVTTKLQARANLSAGTVSFYNLKGASILAEKQGGRTMTPVIVQGDQTFHIRQAWEPNSAEALYGLGQHQLGLMNIKGYHLDLWQHNGPLQFHF